jgi:hypothetical protein
MVCSSSGTNTCVGRAKKEEEEADAGHEYGE